MSSAAPSPDADATAGPGAEPTTESTGPVRSAGPTPLPRRHNMRPEDGAEVVESVERRDLVIRRAPRFAPFLVGGAVVGFIVAGILVLARPQDPQYTPAAALGFFAMLFGVIGVGLGALLALALDRRSHRRARRGSADEVTGTMR